MPSEPENPTGTDVSDDARGMIAWLHDVCRQLDMTEPDDLGAVVDVVLDLTSDVAHGVSRPAAPVTAFLVGLAAGRAPDIAVVKSAARQVARLAEEWPPDV